MKVTYRGEQPKVKFKGMEFTRGETAEVPDNWKMPFDFDIDEMLEENKKPEIDRFSKLSRIEGIGKKTIEDLRDIYGNDFDLLVRDCKSNRTIPIRDDIAKKLKKELGD